MTTMTRFLSLENMEVMGFPGLGLGRVVHGGGVLEFAALGNNWQACQAGIRKGLLCLCLCTA